MVTLTEVRNGVVSLSDVVRICAFLDMRSDVGYDAQKKADKDKPTSRRW